MESGNPIVGESFGQEEHLTVETTGMFIWLRVRLANGKQERRFYKPGLDRLIAPESPES